MLKKNLAKVFAGVLVAAMAITAAVPAMAAEKNPSKDWYQISSWADGGEWYMLADRWDKENIKTVKGISYDEKTNTLTLNNFNEPKRHINADNMGDNFTICVKGKNTIAHINVGGEWGGDLTITGDGTLNINPNRQEYNAIDISRDPNGSEKITLTIEGGVTVNAYRGADEWCPSVCTGWAGKPVYNIIAKNKMESDKQDKQMSVYRPDDTIELELLKNPASVEGTFAGSDEHGYYRLTKLDDGTTIATEWNIEEDSRFFDKTGTKVTVKRCYQNWMPICVKDGKEFAKGWGENDTIEIYKPYAISGDSTPYAMPTGEVYTQEGTTAYEISGYKDVFCDSTYWSELKGDLVVKPFAKTTATVTAAKGTIKAVAKKVTGANGYQMQYSTNKKMTGAKLVSSKTTTITAKGLKSGKTYYVQVRAAKKGMSKNLVGGAWSKVVAVKVK